METDFHHNIIIKKKMSKSLGTNGIRTQYPVLKIFWLFNKQQERESVEFILGEKKHFGTFSGPPEVQQILAWVRISGIFFYMRREAQKTLLDSYYCPRLIRLFLLFCTDLLSSEANQSNCGVHCHYYHCLWQCKQFLSVSSSPFSFH